MTDFRTPDRDVNRAIRSWLREDRHEDVSRIAGAVLDQLDTTPQRRATAWPARRTPTMNKFIAFGLGAAAVVVALFVGVQLFSPPDGGTGSSEPSPSPSTAQSGSPQPTHAPVPDSGAIDAGTYLMTDGVTSFSITIPPGWDAEGGGRDIRKHREAPNEVTFGIYVPEISVFPDACVTGDDPQPTGPTVDDLIAALRAQENSDVSEPAEVMIGGRPAMRLDLSIPEGLDLTECDDGTLKIWVDEAGSYLAGLGPTGSTPVTLVETSSGRVVFYTEEGAEATASDLAELQAIVDSIQFEPAP